MLERLQRVWRAIRTPPNGDALSLSHAEDHTALDEELQSLEAEQQRLARRLTLLEYSADSRRRLDT